MEIKNEKKFFTKTLQTITSNDRITDNFICHRVYMWSNEKRNE